jgi:predicted NBD/HSP70 family sugar kinase
MRRVAGTNLIQSRAYNRLVVLEAIRLGGPLSRAEIARSTALSLQTVLNITEELVAEGLVREEGMRRNGGRGAPAPMLGLRPEGGFTLGLSIDHRRLVLCLVDQLGTPRAHVEETIAGLPPERVLDLAADLTAAALRRQRVPRRRVWGAGLAMPLVFERGIPVAFGPTSVPQWAGLPVRELLAARLAMPVTVENDATAAAMGEQLHGAGRRLHDFFYVYVGAGVGGGLVLRGQPYRGAAGRAGEFGHAIVVPGGHPCACGSRGCLERYASLSAATAALDGTGEGLAPVEPARLAGAMREQQPALLGWIRMAGRCLGTALRTVETLLDPQAIVLGGIAPPEIARALVAEADAARRQPAADRVRKPCPLLLAEATLESPALGAAALALFDSTAPRDAVLTKRWREGRPPASEGTGARGQRPSVLTRPAPCAR